MSAGMDDVAVSETMKDMRLTGSRRGSLEPGWLLAACTLPLPALLGLVSILGRLGAPAPARLVGAHPEALRHWPAPEAAAGALQPLALHPIALAFKWRDCLSACSHTQQSVCLLTLHNGDLDHLNTKAGSHMHESSNVFAALASKLLRTHARQQMISTWIGDAQLVDSLLVHPDLVPDVDSCPYLHHRVGVPLLAAVKGHAVYLLIWLDDSMA